MRSLERLPPIVSDGVHACDRINYLLGEAPVDVTGWSLRTDPAYATANVNGGVLTYADGTVARLEVVWLTPVLPTEPVRRHRADGARDARPADVRADGRARGRHEGGRRAAR